MFLKMEVKDRHRRILALIKKEPRPPGNGGPVQSDDIGRHHRHGNTLIKPGDR